MLALKKQQFAQLLLLAFLMPFLIMSASAKDISNDQRNAYEARQAYNKAKSNQAHISKQITQQEQRVADEQARLDKLRADQTKAQNEVDNRKRDLDAKVQRLNEVWDSRNK